jgi:hypothetical protein
MPRGGWCPKWMRSTWCLSLYSYSYIYTLIYICIKVRRDLRPNYQLFPNHFPSIYHSQPGTTPKGPRGSDPSVHCRSTATSTAADMQLLCIVLIGKWRWCLKFEWVFSDFLGVTKKDRNI